jgi:serine/threonine protein kinase/TPR repeat protein
LLQLGLHPEETAAELVSSGILPASPSSLPPPGASLAEKPGDHIGHYKLLQQIGEGGCGVVYMAQQDEPVRRRVALKIIKLGMDTRNVIARFEAERQALALMDHPNIAKVFDAGSTERPLASGSAGVSPASSVSFTNEQPAGEDAGAPGSVSRQGRSEGEATFPAGRPYFVMELVRGIKITTYCDQQKLSTRQRLDLFIRVCRAIQHAHQKGIIHRDLKPSNILVTEQDGAPVPKIIDFGIAKATTDQRLTGKTLFTAFEQFIGTPAYMSPEQAGLGGLDIDTRSDIYSLGVLLYELLTGETPFDFKELFKAGLDEMRRTIREVEPPKPSTRLTEELTGARVRNGAQGRKGEKENSKIEPTSTSSSPPLYPSTPFPRRQAAEPGPENETSGRLHRLKELIPLLRGDLDWIVMKCLEKDRARRYETANGLASDIQRHLNNEPVVACPPSNLYRFQKLVRRNKLAFAAAGSVVAALVIGLAIALWQSVEKTFAYNRAVAAEQEQTRLRQQAQTEAAKSRQVAQFFKDMLNGVEPSVALGRDTAMLKEILDRTAERIGTDLGNQPEVEAQLRQTIGTVYKALGQYEKAEMMHSAALAIRRSLFGNENLDVAASLQDLGVVLWHEGKLPEAEAAHRQSLKIRRALLKENDPLVASSLYEFGRLLRARHRDEAAEAAFHEAANFGLVAACRALGWIYLQSDRPSEALQWFRKAADSGDPLSQSDLGQMYERGLGVALDGAEALKWFRKAADQGDPRGQYFLSRVYDRGDCVARDVTEAAKWLHKAADSEDVFLLNHLAWVLATSEDSKSRNARDAILFAERVVGLSGRKNPFYLDTLAAAYAEAGQFDKAVSVQEEAIALLRDPQQKKDLTSRLKLYESNFPYRDANQKEQSYP